MNDIKKYSVIIPVYKAKDTIGKCLDSLLYQIPDSAELLVINDGSPDNSGLICKQYEKKYTCIRYFEKENGGVSSARNMGLDYALGNYVLFVDSDDYVDENYWKVIESNIATYQPDMLQWGFIEHGNCINERGTGSYVAIGKQEVSNKIDIALRNYLFCSLPFRSFKLDTIKQHNLRFETDISVGEDQTFIFLYAIHIDSLVSVSDVLYHVVLEKTDSLSRKRRDYLLEQLIRGNELMVEGLEYSSISLDIKKRYRATLAWMYYRNGYSVCKELLKYDLSKHDRRKKIREMICYEKNVVYTTNRLLNRSF